MCGRAAFTTSPSVRSSTRSTPWVAGCWGPIWRIISSVSRASGSQGSSRAAEVNPAALFEVGGASGPPTPPAAAEVNSAA